MPERTRVTLVGTPRCGVRRSS